MSNYKLNGTPLASFNVRAAQHRPSTMALRGAWDMPARIGKTYHDWGNDKGVEPYVASDEIRFAGRDLDLLVYIKAHNKNNALRKAYELFADMDLYTDVVALESDKYGSWNVYVRDAIKADYLRYGWCLVTIPFREPIVDLTGSIPTSDNYSGQGIDGINFSDLGLRVLSVANSFDRPQPKQLETIAYAHEPYRIAPTGIREITVKAVIITPDYESFMAKIRGLYALLSKPGLRFITLSDGALRDFFVKDGFSVSNVRVASNMVSALVELRISEVAAHMDWGILCDNAGNPILTEFGNILIT